MPRVSAPKCPHCDAPLPVRATGTVRCDYCGRESLVQKTQIHQQVAPPVQRPPVQAPPMVTAPQRRPRALVFAVVGMALLGVVPALVIGVRSGAVGRGGSGPGSGGVTPSGEHLQWASSMAPPIPADIDGDGVEDFVGTYQLLEGSDTEIYVGAFAGSDFERLWKVGSLGTLSDAINNTHVAVAGDAVVITDYRAAVHVRALATGEELAELTLSDRAKDLCASPDGDAVWIQVADENNVRVSLPAATAEPAPRPDWCPPPPTATDDCWMDTFFQKRLSHATCRGPENEIDAFAVEYVLEDGDARVALGHKDPGTRVPMAAGLGPLDDVTWKRAIPEADVARVSEGTPDLADLAGGRLVTQYEVGDRWHLVALDAATGDTAWDVVIPRSEDGSEAQFMTVTDRRVYLPHWTWLEVFDAPTGKHLGTVGIW
jgi:hypothetical protein